MTKTVPSTYHCTRCQVNVMKHINTTFGEIRGVYICLCEESNPNFLIKQDEVQVQRK